ncbi:hypothetical protein FRC08_004142 [Ceratobasidium sp. 394]|nr:hypothetical protein FRC08_004142 [Ceratobasidium sp. 394]
MSNTLKRLAALDCKQAPVLFDLEDLAKRALANLLHRRVFALESAERHHRIGLNDGGRVKGGERNARAEGESVRGDPIDTSDDREGEGATSRQLAIGSELRGGAAGLAGACACLAPTGCAGRADPPNPPLVPPAAPRLVGVPLTLASPSLENVPLLVRRDTERRRWSEERIRARG